MTELDNLEVDTAESTENADRAEQGAEPEPSGKRPINKRAPIIAAVAVCAVAVCAA